jgi:hypothetical protein
MSRGCRAHLPRRKISGHPDQPAIESLDQQDRLSRIEADDHDRCREQ